MIGPNSKDLICLNQDCLDYRKRNAGNIIKKGFKAKGNQMFKCKTCGVIFPETKGPVFYNRHLTEEQITETPYRMSSKILPDTQEK